MRSPWAEVLLESDCFEAETCLLVDINLEGISRIELQRRLVIRIQVACYLHDRKTMDSGHNLKDFNAHSGNAAISGSQGARCAKRKVENAFANPGAPVDNAHYHRLGARRIGYANSCAERQATVSRGHGITVESGAAGCFAFRIRIERCFPGKNSIAGPRS
jgi:hypothetical protein